MALPLTDTRHCFRPLSHEIVQLLHALTKEDWERPTVAGAWRVRDVVAHLIDTALRRLSFHRDRSSTRDDRRGTAAHSDLAAFINDLNATWVQAAARLSTRVLTDLYGRVSTDLADFMETLDLGAVAAFPVSWAGERQSVQWLDIGREFTEVWHHGSQIREAVGAGPFSTPDWLSAVLQIAVHTLPHAYRGLPGRPGLSVAIQITGPASGAWTLQWRGETWDIEEGLAPQPTVTVTMPDEVAWRLFFNALPLSKARSVVRVDGNADLADPLLRARSVII